MAFWILIPFLTVLAIAFVAVPLLRGNRALLDPNDKPSALSIPVLRRRTPWLIFGLAVFVAVSAIGLYSTVGRPDLATVEARVDAASNIKVPDNSNPASNMSAMIANLKRKVRQNPKDADGWETLGWAFMHIHQPQDATEAYQHAVTLAPDKREYRSALAESTIQSGDGKISQGTMLDLQRVAAADPNDARAKFYLALYKDQQGDHRGAIADWIALLKAAPADAPWAPEVRRVVEQVAKEQRLNISAELPGAPATTADITPNMASGPSADQVAAAQKMPAGDRNAMIQDMVDRLASELDHNPHDAQSWQRLMRARIVLGEKDKAQAAYRAARAAFAKDPTQLNEIDATAHALGITGA